DPDNEILSRTKLPTCGFRLDILVAGPQEIHAPRSLSQVAATSTYNGGARATVGFTQDKDMSGLEATSRLLRDVEGLLPSDDLQDFLGTYGPEIQESSLAVHQKRIGN